jgi:class 3 adenylate cyclase/predicted ATPase
MAFANAARYATLNRDWTNSRSAYIDLLNRPCARHEMGCRKPDLASWLEACGFGQYADLFAEHAIDDSVLSDLTDEHLRELGLPIGDRIRLLKAIDARRGAGQAAAAARATTLGIQAERRQLTVLFADLVDSTRLAASLDPEDMREVMQAYQNAVTAEIGRLEGHLARFVGDGVLAYFGWPSAHEEDAESAVRAGLALVEAVERLEVPISGRLRARVGIATGTVVVGELFSSGASHEQEVVGETPNLAARLQALAAPGTVLVADTTRRLLGGLFEFADLGTHTLKGFAMPVRAWQVTGAGVTGSRFAARVAGIIAPLIDREAELGLLLERWRQARAGEGQVVLVSGEPGIGKSRITVALREHLQAEPRTVLQYFCSPFHTNSALYPVIAQLERAAEFERDEAPVRKLAKLERVLAEGTDDVNEVIPLFCDLLSLPAEGVDALADVTPRQRRAQIFKVLLDQLAGLAARRPVLIVVEDAQWLDPTSIELFGLIVARIRRLPALLVITSRPEFVCPWSGPQLTPLVLNRLTARAATTLVEGLALGKPLPPVVVAQIVAQADGIPLFLEELSKTVLESGVLQDTGGGLDPAGPMPAVKIPTSLHDSLMARLDRLAAVKEVAQIGAVIGREFTYKLLGAVAPFDDRALQQALVQLVDAGIIFCSGAPPEATYTFKHALVRDAAYGALLRLNRRALHARVAEAYEAHRSAEAEQQPELVAHHYSGAGIWDRATVYWRSAGDRAIKRSALIEAMGHFTQAMATLNHLSPGPARDRLELEIQALRGPTLLALSGFASDEVEAAYARAHELCEQLGEAPELAVILRGRWAFHLVRAELHVARELAERLLALGEADGDDGYTVEALRPLGQSYFFLGDFRRAREHLERCQALYRPHLHPTHTFRYGSDSGVISGSYLGWTLWFLGYPDRAVARAGEALEQARRLAHPFTLAQALVNLSFVTQLRRDLPGTLRITDEALQYAEEHHFPYWAAIANVIRGWAVALAGETDCGSALMREGLAAYRAQGAVLALPWFLATAAEVHLIANRCDEALPLLTEALSLVERYDERFYEPEIRRLTAECLIRRGDRGRQADGLLRRSLEQARQQGARSWELRTAVSLAQRCCERDRERQACEVLAPVLRPFTEGRDTADLVHAAHVLQACGSNAAINRVSSS